MFSLNLVRDISNNIHIDKITSGYRNFSTKLSEGVKVLINQINAYGDIEAKLKIALIEQQKSNTIAAEDVKRKATAQANSRARRESKIKTAAAVKQARANKEKRKLTSRLDKLDNVNSQYTLVMIYHKGQLGVLQDDKEAVN